MLKTTGSLKGNEGTLRNLQGQRSYGRTKMKTVVELKQEPLVKRGVSGKNIFVVGTRVLRHSLSRSTLKGNRSSAFAQTVGEYTRDCVRLWQKIQTQSSCTRKSGAFKQVCRIDEEVSIGGCYSEESGNVLFTKGALSEAQPGLWTKWSLIILGTSGKLEWSAEKTRQAIIRLKSVN